MKGRKAKITKEQAITICDAFDDGGLSVREFAIEQHFSYEYMWRVLTGKVYFDVKAQSYEPFKNTRIERKLTNTKVVQIREMYQNHVTISELSRQFNLNINSIIQVLKGITYQDAGGTTDYHAGRSKFSDEIVIAVRRMVKNEIQTAVIAEMLNLNVQQVTRIATHDDWQHLNKEYPPIEKMPHIRRYKITPKERETIREYFKSGDATMTMSEMAKLYHVSLAYISRIVSNER